MNVRLLHADSARDKPEWIQDFENFEEEWKTQSTFSIFTSGSTGRPKKIEHSKKSMIKSAQLTIEKFELGLGYTSLLCLPIRFIAGQLMYIRSYLADGHLDIAKPSVDPWTHINRRYDFVAMTPMQLFNGIQKSTSKLDFIDKLLLGGAPISVDLQRQIDQLDTQCQIFHSYGMTETITHVAVRALNGIKKSEYFDLLPEIAISISDNDTLIIEAEHLELSPIITRDLVEIRDDRSFKWISRIDDIINSGGLKINPNELESTLKPMISADFFISSEDDIVLGQKVVMVIKSNPRPEFIIELKELVKEKLDKNQIPKSFYFVKEFLYTETGKQIKDLKRYDLSKNS